MLIKITDSLSLNPEAIESLERKGRMSCVIVMVSGEKHMAEFPYEVMLKRINDKQDSVRELIQGIDERTQAVKI